MLIDNFYDLKTQKTDDEASWLVNIRLNPDHQLYNGHFPGQPIVPGVCLMQLIKESVEKIRNTSYQYKQVSSCKFLLPIDPNKNPELELKLLLKDVEDGRLQLNAEGKVDEADFIKLKAVMISK